MLLEAAETEEGDIFRAADGSLLNGEKMLRIRLKDFGNRYGCPRIDNIPGEITIPLSELYNISQQSDIIWRKRDRTPPERLSSPNRKRFKVVEEEVNKRLDDQDSDYEPEEVINVKAYPEVLTRLRQRPVVQQQEEDSD
ncbi:hypothetical protein B0H67DRAFT_584615 [Lasiosphaeris hirsuta]|uniref:Uncharacterized protein n=1 Tax=Lasiosphaeris hirsuta TaxID=260670 RepID=A0AA40A8D2_9PEZI|nr:hypothetical protein B0H67DRAFT_584615 [Lasiosphaeris hirsuta]